MEWLDLDEYEKLVIGMNTPRVAIDNAVCPTATLVQVDSSARKRRGVLLEAVQVLADLDLSVKKAYISSDGRWFMDVFHVIDRRGRKLADERVIAYIQQSLGVTWAVPPPAPAPEAASALGEEEEEELTALELTGADRAGLLSEVFAVLADMGCGVADARAWSHRGRLGCVALLRVQQRGGDAVLPRILARLGHLLAPAGAVAAVPAASVAHADRRLHQLMAADRDQARAFPTPAVAVESWEERGYSVVTVRCRDRPKLLFDVVCTLHDMDYVVFHGTVDTAGGEARQEFYIRRADGSHISTDAESQRLSQCLQAAIERRSLEGLRLELCTPDRPGLLSDVTRTFRENGLLVAQAEVSTKGDVASNVFYVTDEAGNAVDPAAIDAVRERVGVDCLVAKPVEPRPQVFPKPAPGDGGVGGMGLVYLGNLVKRNLYNLGLIKSCS